MVYSQLMQISELDEKDSQLVLVLRTNVWLQYQYSDSLIAEFNEPATYLDHFKSDFSTGNSPLFVDFTATNGKLKTFCWEWMEKISAIAGKGTFFFKNGSFQLKKWKFSEKH